MYEEFFFAFLTIYFEHKDSLNFLSGSLDKNIELVKKTCQTSCEACSCENQCKTCQEHTFENYLLTFSSIKTPKVSEVCGVWNKSRFMANLKKSAFPYASLTSFDEMKMMKTFPDYSNFFSILKGTNVEKNDYFQAKEYFDKYCKTMVDDSNNDYLTELDKVDISVPFFWTGNQVITSNYSDNNIDSWKELFREDRDLIIWDNTFANDYCVPKIVMQNFDGFFSKDDKKVSGFLLNASGIELIDLIAIEILDNALKENQRTLEDILKDREFPKELINLRHFFKINILSSFSDDEKKDLDFLLWSWNGKIKKFFYPYLHQLNQIFNETDEHEINGLKKRFRVKE